MFLREHDFDHLFEAASAKYAIQTAALKAIAGYHSEFNPYFSSAPGTSWNRRGLLGLIVFEARLNDKGLKEADLFHPEKNIDAGAKYFRFLLHRLNNPSYYDCAKRMGVPPEAFHKLYMYYSQKSGEPQSYYPDEVAGVSRYK